MSQYVLIVDDDPVQRRILQEVVKRSGYRIKLAEGGEQALDIMQGDAGKNISLVLLDLVMPGINGMEVLDRLRELDNSPPVIVQTANGSIEAAISAMKAGASDFVVKPTSPQRLETSIRNAMKMSSLETEITRIKRKVKGNFTFDDLIAGSKNMDRVKELGQRAATSNIPVLIEGESGVGKEMIARAILGESERSGKPFVVVNCGAIPENLVESTLFGHEKGAFTGAHSKHTGKFVEADGGTLFLDEVTELPLDAQVKLLRALQEGEVDPVGGKKTIKVNIRLISATNRDMIAQVTEGKFREDLYYRLNVFPVMVPPLRERPGDIPELVRHFITRFAAEEGKRVDGITPDAMGMLQQYSWPGNVRQLENTVFRAIVLSNASLLGVGEFPQVAMHVEGFSTEIPSVPAAAPAIYKGRAMIGSDALSPTPLAHGNVNCNSDSGSIGIPALTDAGDVRCLLDIEADMIKLALGRYRGKMTKVARELGIGRSTLYRKMREFGIENAA
jgi:DNA-binding NtrC family response regulator